MGGTAPTNETMKVIKAFLMLHEWNVELDVIVGELNTNKDKIKNFLHPILTCANKYPKNSILRNKHFFTA
jgi:UDP-2,4-diacetamido-2,4,6-trideoxy-beta-L-altropyranose hydrolase